MWPWSSGGSCWRAPSADVQQEDFASKYLLCVFPTHILRQLQNTWIKIISKWKRSYLVFCYSNLFCLPRLSALRLLGILKAVALHKITDFLCKTSELNPRTFSILFIKLLVVKIHTVKIISPWHVICGLTPSAYRESIWTCGEFSEAWTCPPLLYSQPGTGNLLLCKHPVIYCSDSEPHLGSAQHNSEGERWHQGIGSTAGKKRCCCLPAVPSHTDAQTFALPSGDLDKGCTKGQMSSWSQEKVTACLF